MIDTKFIKNFLLAKDLVSAVFENTTRPNIERIIIRPVEIKGKRNMQISYLDGNKDTTKNFSGRIALQKIGEVLHMEFRNITLQTTQEDIKINVDQKGKIKLTKKRIEKRELELFHDRKKTSILDLNTKYDFLVKIGIQSSEAKIIADKRDKFKQINDFLKIIEDSIDINNFDGVVRILDFGSGAGYLTFAIHYYFQEVQKRKVETIGVDLKGDLVKRLNEIAKDLNWNTLKFVEGEIKDFKVIERPNIVLSLHACDTATDDAITQAIKNNADYIFAVPCCHKYIQNNLPKQKFPRTLSQIASHGILLQRTCDIVTDTFRALILRIKAYKTDVFEFVDSSHSAKNVMIRGVKLPHRVDEKTYRREYEDLKKFWGVTPYLEKIVL